MPGAGALAVQPAVEEVSRLGEEASRAAEVNEALRLADLG